MTATRRTACCGARTAGGSTPSASATRCWPSAASWTGTRAAPTFQAGHDGGLRLQATRTTGAASTLPVFRNALPELFEVFDFADPSMVVGRRNVQHGRAAGAVPDEPPVRARAGARRPPSGCWPSRLDERRAARAGVPPRTLGRAPTAGERDDRREVSSPLAMDRATTKTRGRRCSRRCSRRSISGIVN